MMEETEHTPHFPDEDSTAAGIQEELLNQMQMQTVMLMRIYDALMLLNRMTEKTGGTETKHLANHHANGGVVVDNISYNPEL